MKPIVQAPSIRNRLANALLLWALVWSVGVALAVGYAAQEEVDELLDASLQSTAHVLGRALALAANGALDNTPLPATEEGEFAWQLVGADGTVALRTANAPAQALHNVATVGFSASPGWRVFGHAMGSDGRVLYVAHTMAEREETRIEVALGTVLAALSIGLIGHLWLRLRVKRELLPLERLSERLATHDPLDATQTLGEAERAELAPVHDAIDGLGQRLARRMALEHAFSANAAHALRTPLAGMEAQLAVAERESPPGVQQRLQRVREASGRLQQVVRSLLDLFRVGAEVRRSAVDAKSLLAHLPVVGLEVSVPDGHRLLSADPDLLIAALSNLLDNARRHGARHVLVSTPALNTLRVHDDGPGVVPERLQMLREAVRTQDYEAKTGLGLMLADLVARSHGGALTLPEAPQGFVVELALGTAEPPKV